MHFELPAAPKLRDRAIVRIGFVPFACLSLGDSYMLALVCGNRRRIHRRSGRRLKEKHGRRRFGSRACDLFDFGDEAIDFCSYAIGFRIMCILCVVQRWSRWVATMLPWLLIPLLLFWAMSPFLPPGFRFEITSPQIACVFVLFGTLFWYEILMPKLSLWRKRRSARLWERERALAMEMQKLRKAATRRCRNCHSPYRDQNPGGGRFMCSFCGHVSKRPVLDLPRSVRSSMINELVGKNGWICSQDWAAEGNRNWVNTDSHYCVNGDRFSGEKTSSGVVFFARKFLFCFFANMRWLCRKVFRTSLWEDDSDADRRGSSSKGGENGGNLQESKWEKARRKAEEKRQAKLEKEMLEEEERKQREEVARLVEERRRLRDEKLKAEREHTKGSDIDGEKANRKVAEKGRHDRRKDKDKGSSKSNSDVEDLEKKSRESERKHEFDKKNENDRRDSLKTTIEIPKPQTNGVSHGNKLTSSKPRYFARMTGNFLSSSRGFGSASFFGRNPHDLVSNANKVSKPTTGFMDHVHENKRDYQVAGEKLSKATSNGDDRGQGTNIHQPVASIAPQRRVNPIRSWQQLFTGSASVAPDYDAIQSSCQIGKGQLEAQSSHLVNQRLMPNHVSENNAIVGQPLPSNTYTTSCEPFSSSSFSSSIAESLFPSAKSHGTKSIMEEAEIFEDPCYVPDPISLLGPVSEALDNFPLDLGAGFLSSDKVEEPQVLNNAPAPVNISKPSPIESPISRFRVLEEKQSSFGQVPCTLKSLDSSTLNLDEPQGSWQLWGTSQDSLGLAGGPSSWFLPIRQQTFGQEEKVGYIPHNSMVSQTANESPILLGSESQHIYDTNQLEGGAYNPLDPGMHDSNNQMQKFPLKSLAEHGEHFLPRSLIDNIQQNGTIYTSSNTSRIDSPFELSPANCWFNLVNRQAELEAQLRAKMREKMIIKFYQPSKTVELIKRGDGIPSSVCEKDGALKGPQQHGNPALVKPNVGGLFSTSADTESVWSFSEKETV